MTSHRLSRILGVSLLGASLVSGCSTASRIGDAIYPFNDGENSREAEAERERAGRIAMVLQDQQLEPDPELATMAVILSDPREVDIWAQSGGRASKATGHILAAPSLQVAWSRNVAEGSGLSRVLSVPPVAAEGKIFLLDSLQTVIAIDANNGREIWRRRLDAELEDIARRRSVFASMRGVLDTSTETAFGGGLAVTEGRLVVASGYGYVQLLNTNDGTVIWSRESDAPMTGAPTIYEDQIFVASNNNEIFSMSLETGEVRWTDQAIAESARVLSSPSSAAIEDLLVTPYSSGELIGYLASNGRRLWTDSLTRSGRFTPISQINDIAARPVLNQGLVFAASQSGVLAAIDGRSGQRLWALPFGSTQAPAVSGEFLFAVSVDAELICIQATTGRVVWYKQLQAFSDEEDNKGRISYAGPLIASGRLILTSSTGQVLAFSPQTGEQVDETKLFTTRRTYPPRRLFIEPIAYDGQIILVDDAGTVYALR